jgi:hypothetical protein
MCPAYLTGAQRVRQGLARSDSRCQLALLAAQLREVGVATEMRATELERVCAEARLLS